mmetsp:Transcript_3443/g.5874  ORF Transcript_3443/g.5874 Transcript_3443/m.5874 type:complete len:719 (+) Transcript_3443:297-2453(+)
MVSSVVRVTEVVAAAVVEGAQEGAEKAAAMKAEEERPGSPLDGASQSGGYSSDSSAEPLDVSKMDPETLKARIKAQVEYYFSQHNLNKDAYMISQMNSDGFIAVDTIASFKKLKHLTTDTDLIIEAVADSTILEFSQDKTMLKSSWKRPARVTIILRDVHEDTTEDDIKTLFGEIKVVSARSDVGQTWFVTMETEEDAKSAVLHLLGKTLHGLPVKARLKSETLRPTVSAAAAPFTPAGLTPEQLANAPNGQYPYGGYQPYGNMMGYPGSQVGWSGPGMGQFDGGRGRQRGGPNKRGSADRMMDRRGPRGAAGSYQNGKAGGRRDGSKFAGSDRASVGSGGARKGKKGATTRKPQPAKTPVFQPQDFPSLPMGKISLDDDENNEIQLQQAANAAEGEATNTASASTENEKSTDAPAPATQAMEAVQGDASEESQSQNGENKPVSSWVAALSKAPVPDVVAAPANIAASTSAPAKASQEKGKTPPSEPVARSSAKPAATSASSKQNAASAPATEKASAPSSQSQQQRQQGLDRPKRGWETASGEPTKTSGDAAAPSSGEAAAPAAPSSTSKAGENTQQTLGEKPTAKASDAAAPVEASSTESTSAEADSESLKPNAGAVWGEKKSFLEVIKKSPGDAAPATTPAASVSGSAGPNTNLSSSTSPAGAASFASREGSAAFAKNRAAEPTSASPAIATHSLEGNWRSANRRKPGAPTAESRK